MRDRTRSTPIRKIQHIALAMRFSAPKPENCSSSENAAIGEDRKLRPYQIEGVRFLQRSAAALLADEMGLGKTVQTATALSLAGTTLDRILLITPTSLCLNWLFELNRWAPNLVVRRVIGDASDRAAYYKLPIQLLIASYEQIRSDIQRIVSNASFDLVVLDEAQRIKNNNSDTTLACRLIPRKRAWALSGTPLENEPEDLISIYRFLKPELLKPGMPRPEIHRLIERHFLRRTKSDVLPDLPPITVQDIPLELYGRQLSTYEEVWASRTATIHSIAGRSVTAGMLAVITELKKLCNYEPRSGESVKLDALHEIVEKLKGTDNKAIIFSQYVETLRWIQNRIAIRSNIYHGGLSQQQRNSMTSDFESHPGATVLLISLKAGGVGLNLQQASTVVLFDRWWNSAAENQAIHRAHRFGRASPLHVIRFLVVDSIEERIVTILEEKQDLFNAYINEANNAPIPEPTQLELQRILAL